MDLWQVAAGMPGAGIGQPLINKYSPASLMQPSCIHPNEQDCVRRVVARLTLARVHAAFFLGCVGCWLLERASRGCCFVPLRGCVLFSSPPLTNSSPRLLSLLPMHRVSMPSSTLSIRPISPATTRHKTPLVSSLPKQRPQRWNSPPWQQLSTCRHKGQNRKQIASMCHIRTLMPSRDGSRT